MNHQKIWDKVLSQGEEVRHNFSIGERYIKFNLIVWVIICLPFLFLFGTGLIVYLVILFYFGYYLKVANVYAFTNKRVLIHTGWLSTHVTSIDYSKITDIQVREPFFDRILTHTGHIAINTAGSGNLEVVLRHVQKPYELKKILDELKQ